jgi:hypothetical protein
MTRSRLIRWLDRRQTGASAQGVRCRPLVGMLEPPWGGAGRVESLRSVEIRSR